MPFLFKCPLCDHTWQSISKPFNNITHCTGCGDFLTAKTVSKIEPEKVIHFFEKLELPAVK